MLSRRILPVFLVCLAIPAFAQRGGGMRGGGGGARGGGGFHGGGISRGAAPSGFRGGGFHGGAGFNNFHGGFNHGSFNRFGFRGNFRFRGFSRFGFFPYSYPAFYGRYYDPFWYDDSYASSYPSSYSYPYSDSGYNGGGTPNVIVISNPSYPYAATEPQYVQPPQPEVRDYPQPAPRQSQKYEEPLYLVAFQDHTIRAVLAYWVEGSTLHYVSMDHQQKQSPLTSVDRDLSQRLNRERNVTFRLPG